MDPHRVTVEVLGEARHAPDAALCTARDRGSDRVPLPALVLLQNLQPRAEEVEQRDNERPESDRTHRVGRRPLERAPSDRLGAESGEVDGAKDTGFDGKEVVAVGEGVSVRGKGRQSRRRTG